MKQMQWCTYPQTTSGKSPILPEARKRATARKIVCESSVPMARKTQLFQLIESSRVNSLDLMELQRQVRQLEAEQAAKVRRQFSRDVSNVLEQVQAEVTLEEKAKLPSMTRFRGGRSQGGRLRKSRSNRRPKKSPRKTRSRK